MLLRVGMLAHDHVRRNRGRAERRSGGLTGGDSMHYPKESL
jgi:hypothetical protein